jgi:hypothetical protein
VGDGQSSILAQTAKAVKRQNESSNASNGQCRRLGKGLNALVLAYDKDVSWIQGDIPLVIPSDIAGTSGRGTIQVYGEPLFRLRNVLL